MKKIISIVLSVLFCVFLVGCSSDGGYVRPEYGTVYASDYLVEANKVIYDDETVTFEDGLNELITVSRAPQKVYVLYSSFTPVWYEAGGFASGVLGGDSSIELYVEQIGRDITQDTDENGNAITEVFSTLPTGSSWSTEKLIAADPDLVITSIVMDGYASVSGACETAGIEVIGMDYNTIEDYLKYFKIFSLLNNREELFNEVALEVVDNIVEIVNRIEDADNPSVVSLFSGTGEPMINLGTSSIGGVLEDLKAYNPAESVLGLTGADRLTINIEQMATIDPDFIFIQVHTSQEEADQNIYDYLSKYSVWNTLTAVKNNNVYYAPSNLFHYKANSCYDEAYLYLAEILYPEIDYSDIVLVADKESV